MNKIQTQQLDQFISTDIQLEGNDHIWNLPGFAKFVSNVSEFRGLLSDVLKYQLLQQVNVKNTKLYISIARKDMANQSIKVRSAVQNFASDTNDMLLYKQLQIAESKLYRGAIQKSLTFANTIESKARAIIDELLPYNLTLQELDAYKLSIENFKKAHSQINQIKLDKKNATSKLKELCQATRMVVETKLRKGATQFISIAPDFYNKLIDSFEINNYPTHYTEFEIVTKDKATGEMIGGVKITATSAKGTMQQFSNPIGASDFKQFEPSWWTLTYECPGYEILTMPNVKADLGVKKDLVAELVKVR